LSSAIRTPIILGQIILVMIGERLCTRYLTADLLRHVYRFRLMRFRPRLALCLVLIGFPGIWPPCFMIIIIFPGSLLHKKFCSAKAAKLTLLGVGLTAVWALDHGSTGLNGKFHNLINESY